MVFEGVYALTRPGLSLIHPLGEVSMAIGSLIISYFMDFNDVFAWDEIACFRELISSPDQVSLSSSLILDFAVSNIALLILFQTCLVNQDLYSKTLLFPPYIGSKE